MEPAELTNAAGRLDVELDARQCECLIRHVALVEKWNRHFNLVSRQDIDRLWTRHVLDSLSVLPLVREHSEGSSDRRTQALDVGTGAGFPGLPLAIAAADIDWLLLDRNARKIRFLELVVAELGLTNVSALCIDLGKSIAPGKSVDPGKRAIPAEDSLVDIIVSRAVAGPVGFVQLSAGRLRPGGAMILMTSTGACDTGPGDAGVDEVALQAAELAAAGFKLESVRQVAIAGLGRCHQLSIIRHT